MNVYLKLCKTIIYCRISILNIQINENSSTFFVRDPIFAVHTYRLFIKMEAIIAIERFYGIKRKTSRK